MEHLRKNTACLLRARSACPLIAEPVAVELDKAELQRLRTERGLGRSDFRPFEEDAFLLVQSTEHDTSPNSGGFLEDFLN